MAGAGAHERITTDGQHERGRWIMTTLTPPDLSEQLAALAAVAEGFEPVSRFAHHAGDRDGVTITGRIPLGTGRRALDALAAHLMAAGWSYGNRTELGDRLQARSLRRAGDVVQLNVVEDVDRTTLTLMLVEGRWPDDGGTG
jgi:hypothetical protein